MAECCPVNVCLNFTDVTTTPEFEEKMKVLFCRLFKDACKDCGFGCPNQTGETVILCFEGGDIEVPQDTVKEMLENGATCGGCDEGCCPDTPVVGGKIDMCLNDHPINVSVNACEELRDNAGATCGPCEEE